MLYLNWRLGRYPDSTSGLPRRTPLFTELVTEIVSTCLRGDVGFPWVQNSRKFFNVRSFGQGLADSDAPATIPVRLAAMFQVPTTSRRIGYF